ncbi:MAG TPA: isoprenylcysteine carboxylmethyltransferase family protein [Rhodothermales bacterium]
MSRFLSLLYGTICYVMFLVVLLYAIGFVGNLPLPKTIDSGTEGPLAMSIIINLALLSLFAVQHSVMARRGFKRWWTKFVPHHIERSTFVLLTNLVLILLFWQWRPIPETVWTTSSDLVATVMIVLFWGGWGIVLISTFLIDHFGLFGLRQVILHFQGKEYPHGKFMKKGLYKWVRHPLMLGFIVAFWATPDMTVGHLLFAAVTTAYILVAIQIEERDLVAIHGEDYHEYRQNVSMLFPLRFGNGGFQEPEPSAVQSGE